MPQYHSDLWAALVSLIGSAWPEVKAHGIYRSREMARIDWDKHTRERGFPLCIVDMEPQVVPGYSLDSFTEAVVVSVYRIIGPDDEDDAAGLIESLEAMRTAFNPDDGTEGLDGFQLLEYPNISDSITLPLNDLFLRMKQPFYGGAVIARVLAGATL